MATAHQQQDKSTTRDAQKTSYAGRDSDEHKAMMEIVTISARMGWQRKMDEDVFFFFFVVVVVVEVVVVVVVVDVVVVVVVVVVALWM